MLSVFRIHFIIAAVVVFFPCAVMAEGPLHPVAVTAEVDRSTVAIGDKVRYTIRVEAPKDIEIEFPDFGDNLGGFAVKDFGSEEKTFFGKKRYAKWFLLDTYVSGTYEIPPTFIKYKEPGDEFFEEIETETIEIIVESILETSDERQDIFEIKKPHAYPERWGLYLAIVLGVLIIILSIVGIIYFRKKKAGESLIPPKPAHEIAYQALSALERKQLIDKGLIKDFFSELSLIIRHYVEDRFDIRAPEMTTEEFLVSVKTSDELQAEQKCVLREFLERSDMVKFAKYGPAPEEIRSSFAAARRLVDETRYDADVKNAQVQYDL